MTIRIWPRTPTADEVERVESWGGTILMSEEWSVVSI